jgi:hypothetical protein
VGAGAGLAGGTVSDDGETVMVDASNFDARAVAQVTGQDLETVMALASIGALNVTADEARAVEILDGAGTFTQHDRVAVVTGEGVEHITKEEYAERRAAEAEAAAAARQAAAGDNDNEPTGQLPGGNPISGYGTTFGEIDARIAREAARPPITAHGPSEYAIQLQAAGNRPPITAWGPADYAAQTQLEKWLSGATSMGVGVPAPGNPDMLMLFGDPTNLIQKVTGQGQGARVDASGNLWRMDLEPNLYYSNVTTDGNINATPGLQGWAYMDDSPYFEGGFRPIFNAEANPSMVSDYNTWYEHQTDHKSGDELADLTLAFDKQYGIDPGDLSLPYSDVWGLAFAGDLGGMVGKMSGLGKTDVGKTANSSSNYDDLIERLKQGSGNR